MLDTRWMSSRGTFGPDPDLGKTISCVPRLKSLHVWRATPNLNCADNPKLTTLRIQIMEIGEWINWNAVSCSAQAVHIGFEFYHGAFSKYRHRDARAGVRSFFAGLTNCGSLYLTAPDKSHSAYERRYSTDERSSCLRDYFHDALEPLVSTLETFSLDVTDWDSHDYLRNIMPASSLRAFTRLKHAVVPIGFLSAVENVLTFFPPSIETVEIVHTHDWDRDPIDDSLLPLAPFFESAPGLPLLRWVAVYKRPNSLERHEGFRLQMEELGALLGKMNIAFGLYDLSEYPKLSSRSEWKGGGIWESSIC